MTYVSMGLISEHTPSQTIRTIYSELLRLLFWGHPLRGLRGTPETINRVAAPFLNRMLQALDERDVFGFSTVLEELVARELCITVNQLVQLRDSRRGKYPNPRERRILGKDEIK